MEKIFVSYRRQDNRWATGRICDQLNDVFGADQVFRDIDDIEIGKHFPERIEDTIRNCAVMLVIMGKQWVALAGTDGTPRILQEGDWVRREIEIAVAAGVEIIPILIEGAQMPRPDQVPASFGDFCQRNAITITDENYSPSMERLIDTVKDALIHVQTGLWGRLLRFFQRDITIAPLGLVSGLMLAFLMHGIGFDQVIASQFYFWPDVATYDASHLSYERFHEYSILFLWGYIYEVFSLVTIGLLMVVVYRVFRIFRLMLVFGLGAILGDILILNILIGNLFLEASFAVRILFVIFWALIVQSRSAQAFINMLLAFFRQFMQPQYAFDKRRESRRV